MLTDLKIRAAKPRSKNYKIYDHFGLFLAITPTDCRYWRMRYQIENSSREMSLGSYPDVSLLQARKAVLDARAKLKDGIDPLGERDEAARVVMSAKRLTEDTFSKAVQVFVGSKKNGWSATHQRDVARIFAKELLPSIGSCQMAAITKRDLKDILDRIIARNALSFVRDVLCYYGMVVRHYNCYSDVPVVDYSVMLRAYLPKQPKEKHHAALPLEKLGEFMARLRHSESSTQVRLGLELLILTMVRTTELRGARWEEFDFKAAVWSIPAARMKNGIEHQVPLTRRAIELLSELARVNGTAGLLLKNERSKDRIISENTFLKTVYNLGYQGIATPHGFRAVASTLLNDAGFQPDAIETQLAHVQKDQIRAAYNHGDYWAIRVQLMEWWASYVAQKESYENSNQKPTLYLEQMLAA
jgi:integrase